MTDEQFMREALTLARKGWGFTSPNPMVGAVVVRDGVVVGRGCHEAVGGPHAEVNALADAGEQARGATLYVNLEPCNHEGRTPPCTRAILEAGISRVVVAMDDPNPSVAGGGNALLRSRGVAVTSGVLETEARRLNEIFIKFVTTRQPFVVLKCAATLDGRIATRTRDSRWVTGPAARSHVHEMRHGLDGIMVGIGTVISDNPRLTTRRADGQKGLDPVRIILDTKLSIPEDAEVLRVSGESDTILVTGEAVSSAKRKVLRSRGVKVLEAPLRRGEVNLNLLMNRLGYIGISSLLIEGGSKVIASSLRARIVDKVLFFYAPKILGGSDGVPMCDGPGPDFMRQCVPIRDMALHPMGDDFLVEGYIDKSATW
ncbi:MAG: bifunctional diaminohydroxyphosphoribosylaminopyrimidine deaminase/5-amino-6-(5-phosphoribosylamino)uracil reductase RibD [Desulfococcaceae bacterium]